MLSKISRFDKNMDRLYYNCDFGCDFISRCGPINNPRGYLIKTITQYGGDEQIMVYTSEMQELKGEIKKFSSRLDILKMGFGTLKRYFNVLFLFCIVIVILVVIVLVKASNVIVLFLFDPIMTFSI